MKKKKLEEAPTTRGAFIVSEDPQDRRGILFEVAKEVPRIPEDQEKLMIEVERTLAVIDALYPEADDSRFRMRYQELLSLAQAGLVGEKPKTSTAQRALDQIREEILLIEGGRVKNEHMERLGWKASLLGFLALLGAFFLQTIDSVSLAIGDFLSSWVSPLPPPGPWSEIATFLYLWAGCMAGVWVSFGARRVELSFEQLQILEEDRLEPTVRLIFAGILTTILGLLLSTRILTIEMGAFSTASIFQDTKIALLLGLLSGFSEQTLANRVASEAARVLKLGK